MIYPLDKVIHFSGPEHIWLENIRRGTWINKIVFGDVTDETGKKTNRFYAGKNSKRRDFEYKTAITLSSIADALVYLQTEKNAGLLVNIINDVNPEETGMYVINYVDNGSALLLINVEDWWDYINDLEIMPEDQLRFTSVGASLFRFRSLSTNQYIEYSINGSHWELANADTVIHLYDTDILYLRGILSDANDENNYTQFTIKSIIDDEVDEHHIQVDGNINYLWNYEDLNAPLKPYCGYKLFERCTTLFNNSMELPSEDLVPYCYAHMFKDCYTINYIKCLAVDLAAEGCILSWVENVAEYGTFIKSSDTTWPSGVNGIPESWTVEEE